MFSIARRSVHLQIALHVLAIEQLRQFVHFGGFDFAIVFAKLWRHVIQFQFRVDFLFGTPCDVFFGFKRSQLILIQRITHFVRAATEPDVVLP